MDGYEASNSSNCDATPRRKIRFQRPRHHAQRPHAHTVTNAYLSRNYDNNRSHRHDRDRVPYDEMPIRSKHRQRSLSMTHKNHHRQQRNNIHHYENEYGDRDQLQPSISEQIRDVSHNGLNSLKAFANKMAGGATKFFASPTNAHQGSNDGIFSPSGINNIIRSIKQTNESVGLVNKIWKKSVMGLVICMAFICIFVLIPEVLSLIWLALGFELVDKGHYIYTVVFFFVTWGLLSCCVCIVVLIVHCRQKPS